MLVWLFLIPAYAILWVAGDLTDGRISTAQTTYFFSGGLGLLGLSGLVALGLGTLVPLRPSGSGASGYGAGISPLLLALGMVALVGYLYWFRDLLLKPGEIIHLLVSSGSASLALKESLDRQAGLASLAQLGLPYLLVYSAIDASEPKRLGNFHRLLFRTVLAAITFRAFAWAERLALVEAAVAITFARVSFLSSEKPWLRWTVRAFPLISVVGVILLFSVGEYFRSWVAFYQYTDTSFAGFIFQRLTNYYFTSLNTGAGYLAVFPWPNYEMQTVLEWAHRLPFFGEHFKTLIGQASSPAWESNFFRQYGDPEFNNVAGLFTVFFDLGIAPALALFALIGAGGRYAYQCWLSAHLPSGVFYFSFIMTAAELFRYFYLGSSRTFLVLVGLGLAMTTAARLRAAVGTGMPRPGIGSSAL